MPVIALAASKGGVGKTTLSAALAVEAARSGRVAILDTDPQQSLARWHEIRASEADGRSSLTLINPGKYVDETARRIARDFDWVLIDTPPALILTIEAAIRGADLVVVPTRPSPLDVESIDPVVELCEEHARPLVFVLTQTVARSTMTEGARRFLASRGAVLDIEIVSRQIHAGAMLRGLSAAEVEPKGASATEIATLWQTVERRAKGLAATNGLAGESRLAP